jgi:hypothetical protein
MCQTKNREWRPKQMLLTSPVEADKSDRSVTVAVWYSVRILNAESSSLSWKNGIKAESI